MLVINHSKACHIAVRRACLINRACRQLRVCVYTLAVSLSFPFLSNCQHIFAQTENLAALLDEFRANAAREWRKHRTASARLSGTRKVIVHFEAMGSRPERREELIETIKIGNDRAVFIRSVTSPPSASGFAMGYNERYAFRLSSRRDEGTEKWAVRDLAFDRRSRELKKIQEAVLTPNYFLTGTPQMASLESLLDATTKVSVLGRTGELITVDFQRNGGEPKHATAVLDRANYWTLRDLKWISSDGSRSEYVLESRVEGGIPILSRRIERTFRTANPSSVLGDVTEEYNLVYPPNTYRQIDFTLTAFGLPEPPGTLAAPWPVSSFIIIAVVGILLAFVGRWLYRRGCNVA